MTPAADESTDGSKEVKDEDVEMGDASLSDQAKKDDTKDGVDPDGEKESSNKAKNGKGESAGSTKEKVKDGDKSASDVPPVEVIDVDELDTKGSAPAATAQATPTPATAPVAFNAFNIDVSFEASKLPLDVAIFNSARAAGGDEKIRKYLQAVLVIGGTALVPGMAHALESRYGTQLPGFCVGVC